MRAVRVLRGSKKFSEKTKSAVGTALSLANHHPMQSDIRRINNASACIGHSRFSSNRAQTMSRITTLCSDVSICGVVLDHTTKPTASIAQCSCGVAELLSHPWPLRKIQSELSKVGHGCGSGTGGRAHESSDVAEVAGVPRDWIR